MMKEEKQEGRGVHYFQQDTGGKRCEEKNELKRREKGALTRKDRERGDQGKGGKERGGELVVTAR